MLIPSVEGTLLDRMQEEWKEQAEHFSQYEQSLRSDTDLAGFFSSPKSPNKTFMDKERHRHDSLYHEMEHAIDTDPYLSFITDCHEKGLNRHFMKQENRRHDSLLNEIQHAMESDPDLDGLMM